MSKTLIVMIILGLLLTWKFILFPEELEFTDKMKVLKGLILAKSYKEAVGKYWQEKQLFPNEEQWTDDGPMLDVDLGNSIVSTIKVGDKAPGSITVYYSNARDQNLDPGISGKSLSLTPYVHNGVIEWSCKGNVPVEFLPRPCR